MNEPLLALDDVTLDYEVGHGVFRSASGTIRAIDRLSLTIREGETVALVGESGCGKTSVARCIGRLTDPTSGRIRYRGRDIATFDRDELRAYRRAVQFVFQDPFGALNPRMTVEALIAEPLRAHGVIPNRGAARARARALLELVGVSADAADRYPHEFSGGQRQRIVIARAVGLEPELLVLDEPVASLDVSIAAQILNLLMDLRDRLGVAYLLISHDLATVRNIADRTIVMYLGAAVERAPVEQLFTAPHHPYTQALLSNVPLPDPRAERGRERLPLPGEVPDGLDRPPGCRFHPRCFKAEARCTDSDPPLEEHAPDHHAACWFAAPTPVP